MKRRAFFGFLGGAAVAGPSVVKTAATMTPADLNLGRLGISAGLGGQPGLVGSGTASGHTSWAKDRLKQISGLSKIEKEMLKRQAYFNDLDPQVASLRSVALVHRIRMSRDISFERSEEREKSYLQGVIEGWWA